MNLLRIVAIVACFAFCGVWAQPYPSKAVHVVVGFPAGGGADLLARVIAAKLSEQWKVGVVVENRPGAGGAIGAALVAKAAPDGHTMLFSGSGLAVLVATQANLAFDPLEDLAAIALLEGQPHVMVTGRNASFRSVDEVITAARAAPGKLNYGSVGIGSQTHFSAESFRLAASIDAVHVPYRGGGPEVIRDVVSGEIAYWFAPYSFVHPFLNDGRVRALAVAAHRRSPLLPDVPTLAEAGVKDFQPIGYWTGIWLPSGTAPEIMERLVRDVNAAVHSADLRDRLARFGAEPTHASPAEIQARLRHEMELTARLMKAAGLKPK